MATLKMVKGQTFACPPIFGAERVIVRGEEVVVDDPKHVKLLLDETYSDASNNVHNYFKEVDGDSEDDGDDTDASTTKKSRSRKKG